MNATEKVSGSHSPENPLRQGFPSSPLDQSAREERILLLQHQARTLVVLERDEAKIRAALLKIRDFYSGLIGTPYAPSDLSQRLDCLELLIG